MYNNKYSDQLLPLITPEMLSRYPDQTCEILNKLIRLAQSSSTGVSGSGGEGNLEDIVQTTTSYADGGVNIVTAYLSDGTTQDFQIRNGHQGSQGDPGNPGAPGADGQDATIAVGTTTTLPAGSNATVTDSGTPSAAVLDFGIPRGADGQNGQDGFSPVANVSKSGDTATITITDENGTTTATVTDGTNGAPGQAATVTAGTTTTLPAGSLATVTNSGTSSAAIFDFGIPKGDTGAAGQDGADGADGFSPIATVSKVGDTATITITDENGTTTATVTDGANGSPGAAATIAAGTTTTLSPGSSATVTNSGTSSAAVFDFGIPQGAAGAPGADGYSPTASVSKVGDTATITITDQNGTTTASITDGAAGSPGTSATVTAGTTTTLPAGSSATVTNSGTSTAAVFDFGIPKGDTGAAGQDGVSPVANVTKVGDTATITITDANGTTTANITDGTNGSPGAAATVTAGNTTTLPAGSSASVTNSGTSSAAVFDFSIPQGADGQDSFVPDLATLKAQMLDIVYPVGSIYMSTNNVSPQSFLGGTWTQIQDTFLLSAGSTYTAGATGGDATTTLTKANLPNHTHTYLSGRFWNSESNSGSSKIRCGDSLYAGYNRSTGSSVSGFGGGTGDDVNGNLKAEAFNNMPPYLVVYVWKRTS